MGEAVGAAGVAVAPPEREGAALGNALPRPLVMAGGDGVAVQKAEEKGEARSAVTVGGAEGGAEGEPPLGEGVAPAREGALAVAARAGVGVPAHVAETLAVEVGALTEAVGEGHEVKLCEPCGSAYEGDTTPGRHAAAVRRTLTSGSAGTKSSAKSTEINMNNEPICDVCYRPARDGGRGTR